MKYKKEINLLEEEANANLTLYNKEMIMHYKDIRQ